MPESVLEAGGEGTVEGGGSGFGAVGGVCPSLGWILDDRPEMGAWGRECSLERYARHGAGTGVFRCAQEDGGNGSSATGGMRRIGLHGQVGNRERLGGEGCGEESVLESRSGPVPRTHSCSARLRVNVAPGRPSADTEDVGGKVSTVWAVRMVPGSVATLRMAAKTKAKAKTEANATGQK